MNLKFTRLTLILSTGETKPQVMLLCGSDLLESFNKPGVWSDEDVKYHPSLFNHNNSANLATPLDGSDCR